MHEKEEKEFVTEVKTEKRKEKGGRKRGEET